ncbi:MAG: glycosyltransferase family 2 protein [Nanoarchaeota archaeon]|nr:glycosyltransferase family 2 protein [Nanoarchaeota archaeon]
MFEIKEVKDVKEMYINTAIIIPVFNEQNNIAEVIDESIKVNPKYIVVIDDASTDNTSSILKNYKGKSVVKIIRNKKNMGKQGSVKKGFEEVTKLNNIEAVVTIDADMQHPPEYIPKLVSLLKEYDMVIAKRSKDDMPLSRKIANGLVKMSYHAFGVPLNDVQTGYRAYNFESAKFISDNLEIDGKYNIEHDILDIMAKLAIDRNKEIKIAEYEVPCPYGITESHIRFRDNLSLFKGTLKTVFKLKKRIKEFKT